MPLSRRALCAAALAFGVLSAAPAGGQTKIRYLLTSPSPNVAEAIVFESIPLKATAVLDSKEL